MNDFDFDFGGDDFDSDFDSGFGDNSLDDFNLDTGETDLGGFSDDSSGDNNPDGGAFGSQFTDADFPDTPEDAGGLKKQAIIFIAVGVIALILVIALAPKILKLANNDKGNNSNVQTVKVDADVNNIMNNNINTGNTSNNINSVVNSNNTFNWTTITDNEQVVFNDSYSEFTFTITEIRHLARTSDTNNNLVVKTKLLGSLSGMSGTYEIDVPYNTGVKLVVGNHFTVLVQLGTFNGKTVVGEIKP